MNKLMNELFRFTEDMHVALRDLNSRVERAEGESAFCGISIAVDARVLARMLPLMHAQLDGNVQIILNDGAELSLARFLAEDEGLTPEEIQTLRDLRVGETAYFGGGAEARWNVGRAR